jgi:hypothetical protein
MFSVYKGSVCKLAFSEVFYVSEKILQMLSKEADELLVAIFRLQ